MEQGNNIPNDIVIPQELADDGQVNITYRPYRRLLIGLLTVGILSAICGLATNVRGAEKGDVAVVASTESPPYRMFEGGPPRGIFIDILEAVLRQANLTSRYHVLPFKRCLAELKTGTADLFVGLFYRPEREAYLIYLKPTIAPYVTKVFYLNKGRARHIQKWEDLYPLRIGIRDGYKHHPDFDADQRIQKFGVTTDEQNFHKLAHNRIDALLITEETGIYLIDKLGYSERFAPAPLRLERDNPAYIVMSRKSRLKPHIPALETAIAEIVANGTLEAIRQQYLRHR
jgi:polar amino acid transport system substrate-binding protein